MIQQEFYDMHRYMNVSILQRRYFNKYFKMLLKEFIFVELIESDIIIKMQNAML